MPKISVVMAVHNGLPFLQAAVDSILNQTCDDFEFLVVDDASTDGGLAILHAYPDKRIRLVRNTKQSGLSQSLNQAIDLAQGKYVARMDHDDISLPLRLESQADFLDRHPAVDVVGAWAFTIGDRAGQIWKLPLHDSEIRSELVFNPALVHSSVMFRRMAFLTKRLHYDPKLLRAQDYDLWCRAAGKIRFANIDKVLMHYRIHQRQIGKQHASEQIRVADEIRTKQLQKLGLHPTEQETNLHHNISRWRFSGSVQELLAIGTWLNKLWAANLKNKHLPVEAFRRSLGKRWLAACRASINLGLEAWSIFTHSRFSKSVAYTERAVLWAKCLSRQWGWRNG